MPVAGLAPPLITAVMLCYGWRMSFWVCAAIGCVAGLVWYLVARDRPEQHRGVNERELELIRAGLTMAPRDRSTLAWSAVFASREVH